MPVATRERKAKATKQVQLIARYALKSNPAIVVYTVRSSNGNDQYRVTLYNGHASGCDCPSYKPCYHMSQVEAIESKRTEEMCEALALAPIIVGEQFAEDLEAHVEDEVGECEQAAYAILAQERRAQAPLQPSGHVMEETEFGAVLMRRAS